MGNDLENIANKYYRIHVDVANSRIIHDRDCEEFKVEEVKAKDALHDLNNRLNIKLKANGKVSKVLIKQLLNHHLQVGEKYIIKNEDIQLSVIEYFQSREILDLIELIEEDKCSTVRKSFGGKHLKGLEHVHHGAYATKGNSAIMNCIKYWYNNGKIIDKRKPELQEILNESKKNIAVRMYDKAIRTLIAKGLTGEWLVYKKHNEINYYLCLAKHDEGDQAIYENKIRPCLIEFPELGDNIREGIKIKKEKFS